MVAKRYSDQLTPKADKTETLVLPVHPQNRTWAVAVTWDQNLFIDREDFAGSDTQNGATGPGFRRALRGGYVDELREIIPRDRGADCRVKCEYGQKNTTGCDPEGYKPNWCDSWVACTRTRGMRQSSVDDCSTTGKRQKRIKRR